MKIFFAWYDLWIGVYIDRDKRRVYICPLPCVVVMVSLPAAKGVGDGD